MTAPLLPCLRAPARCFLLLALIVVAQSACSPVSAPPAPAPQRAEGAVPVRPGPSPTPQPPRNASVPPRVGALSVLVQNFDTGAVLYAKRADVHHPIASLTKIMTAMVVLRTTDPTDVVSTSRLAARQEPTELGLRPGERMNVHDLLYALLLHSSN